jgi:hypothetical protein
LREADKTVAAAQTGSAAQLPPSARSPEALATWSGDSSIQLWNQVNDALLAPPSSADRGRSQAVAKDPSRQVMHQSPGNRRVGGMHSAVALCTIRERAWWPCVEIVAFKKAITSSIDGFLK